MRPRRLVATVSAALVRPRVPRWLRDGHRSQSSAAANVCWRRRSLRNATAWCQRRRRRRIRARCGLAARLHDRHHGQRVHLGRRRHRRGRGLLLLVRVPPRRSDQRRHPAARRHRCRRRPNAGAGPPARRQRWCRAWAWRSHVGRVAAPNDGAPAASPLRGPGVVCARPRADAAGVGATRAQPRGESWPVGRCELPPTKAAPAQLRATRRAPRDDGPTPPGAIGGRPAASRISRSS